VINNECEIISPTCFVSSGRLRSLIPHQSFEY